MCIRGNTGKNPNQPALPTQSSEFTTGCWRRLLPRSSLGSESKEARPFQRVTQSSLAGSCAGVPSPPRWTGAGGSSSWPASSLCKCLVTSKESDTATGEVSWSPSRGKKGKMQIVAQHLYRVSGGFKGENDCCWGAIALVLFNKKHWQEI